ncbi:Stealth protein CR1, conserved region 1 [Pedococcus dokdonensis]|uniref:Stealth protein CR1, conserved region 1 n=1 Tax=Pedococcus dokdonensis TaxID=443156 RepID=A0A1H0TIK6_9MICO|nr:stealth family protein [Pedococcus dokdonensis]SDP53376.1 Stealth protein CR1, conserved region 1 [Pedococcus dokdonensis]
MQNLARSVPLPLRQRAHAVVPAPLWRLMRRVTTGQTRPQVAWRRTRTGVFHLSSGQRSARTAAIEVQGHTYLALRTGTFRSSTVIARHLALVADAFEKHDVPYFVLDAQSERRRVVVVAAEHRQRALRALRAELGGEPTYLARVRDKSIDAPRLVGRSAPPRAAKVIRVFQVLVSESGSFLGGPVLGCDVEFWRRVATDKPATFNGEPLPAGTLTAPRRNPWVDVITPSEQKTVLRPVDGTPRPVLDTIAHPHLFTVTEPIDVVYTWVDGSDPAWLSRKAVAQAEFDQRTGGSGMHALAANDSRFASRDELRYSLRSLDMYADWVRHVYLVTDGQVPEWLDTSHPRLTLVPHQVLFGDRGVLPTFNSHAIESQLHRIEGLSEQYLYLNDDVFFGRPVPPSLFFHSNGISQFYLSSAKIGLSTSSSRDMPVMSAGKNNRDLVAKMFDRTISNKFQHVPHALRRSVMLDMEQDFPADFERTAASQFRSHQDVSISASLAHYYAYATGRAVPGTMKYLYADIARDDTVNRLSSLLRQRNVDVFCLNDHDSDSVALQTQDTVIRRFLESYFPIPSQFERSASD